MDNPSLNRPARAVVPADALPTSRSGAGGAVARRAWIAGGWLCLALGTIGIVMPLLPTVDMYGLAAFCFARGSQRWEAWLLNHARLGPLVRDWRANRSVPLGAKCLATLSMSASCAWAAVVMPASTAWIPAVVCLLVASYLWSRPTRRTEKPVADAE